MNRTIVFSLAVILAIVTIGLCTRSLWPGSAAVSQPVPEDGMISALKHGVPIEREDILRNEAMARTDANSPASEISIHSVIGRVVSTDGTPIDSVKVSFSGQRGDQSVAVTDALGAFRLCIAGSGSGVLAFRAATYADQEASVSIPKSGELLDTGEWTLRRVGMLSGIVVDSSGRAIESVRFVLLREAPGETIEELPLPDAAPYVSDSDGRFSLPNLSLGRVKLRVSHDQYASRDIVIDLLGDGIIDSYRIELLETFAIGGYVEMSGTQLAYRYLKVLANSIDSSAPPIPINQVYCRANGEFVISGLKYGQAYDLSVHYCPHGTAVVPPPLADPVRARAGDKGVKIAIGSLYDIRLKVVDAMSRQPVLHVGLKLQWWSDLRSVLDLPAEAAAVVAVSSGDTYIIQGVASRRGEATQGLCITAPGYVPHVLREFKLGAGGTVDLGVISLRKSPYLRVRVIDDLTSLPVPEAEVLTVVDMQPFESASDPELVSRFGTVKVRTVFPNSRIRTDDKGEATIPLIEDALCWLTAQHSRYAPMTPMSVIGGTASASTVVEFRLCGGSTVRAVVKDSAGTPMQGMRIDHALRGDERLSWMWARSNTANQAAIATDKSGEAKFAHLSPGVHQFRLAFAKGDFQDHSWHNITVLGDQEAVVMLSVEQTATLSGQVIINADVASEAEVVLIEWATAASLSRGGILESLAPSGRSMRADTQGKFVIERVPFGKYLIQVYSTRLALAAEQAVTIDESYERQDFLLTTGRIIGTVLGEAGRRVPNAQVCLRTPDSLEEIIGGALAYAKASKLWVRADANGRYVFDGVQPDREVMLVALADGMQPVVSDIVMVASGQERRVDLVMSLAGTIEVQIWSDRGLSAMFAGIDYIEAHYEGDAPMALTRRIGRPRDPKVRPFLFEHMPPGEWRLRLVDILGNSSEALTQIVRVNSGQTTSVSFTIH